MARMKIQSLQSLRDEMKAVARGERPAPADRKAPSVAVKRIVVEIDPCANRDRLRVA